MFCVSYRPACHGCDVHGHEQRNVPSGRRDPQDERITIESSTGNEG